MTRLKDLAIPFILALMAFSLLFSGRVLNFWYQMAFSVSALCAVSAVMDIKTFKNIFTTSKRSWLYNIGAGIASAGLLYAVFFVGDIAACRIIKYAPHDIASVYDLKHGTNPWFMAAMIAFFIAPGEEIFWRGYMQKGLETRYGKAGVVIAALAYAGVHVASGNPMLIIAALICGLFWGYLFIYSRSIWANIVSHVVWDLAVFLIWSF